jgi:alpha-mannosidase
MKVFILFFMIVIPAILAGQDQKKLYISNDDHTDYMWTGNESQYREAFIKMLDFYIDQSDKTAALPSPYQSRFNCDGTFWLWEYEKHKTQEEFQKLIAKVKSGHISFPYNALVSCYGAQTTEGTLRGMYYAGHMERKYNLEIDQAVAMEDQTLPLGLSSMWAGSGAMYSWKGVCNCATKVIDLKKRNKEIYWYKGLDDQSVLMKWYSITGDNKSLGGYAEARDPELAVEQLTKLCGSPHYPYHIAGAFGKGWDDQLTLTDMFTATAQKTTNEERQVIVSNQSDFFKAFDNAYGKVIPSETLSYGNEWDLYSASMSELSAKVKRSVEKLRAAEAMASMVRIQDKNFANGLNEMRKNAWMALGLYYEHNWTADGPVSRVDRSLWQRKIENQITTYVDSLYSFSNQKLGEMIKGMKNTTRFYVFNPLSWKRTDVCDFSYSGINEVRVIDILTGLEVPSQRYDKNGKQYIRILATDIPSMGYKVFEVRQGKPALFPKAATVINRNIENSYFKITLTNQGVITSLIDKVNGHRECVSRVNGKFMNDLGAGEDNSGTMEIENVGPVSVTVRCIGKNPLAHTTRITLFHGIPRIDIDNQITQNFGDVQSWSFSYNFTDATIWHEELGAILKAKPVTEGGHYASMNTRFDWLTLNHFADINDGNYGILLSNADCSFMKLGNSALTNLDTHTSQLSVLAGGQVDGNSLGIPNQGGDSLFTQRFALGTYSNPDAAAAMRFSLEHQNPLISGIVTGTKAMYPEKVYSLLNVNDPSILVWSIKPAEDDITEGVMVRLWNFDKDHSDFKISFEQDITSAYQTTHVETDLGKANLVNGDLHENIGHQQIKTFRIILKPKRDGYSVKSGK